MSVSVRQSSLGAFETLVLENRRLRVLVVPALGGRVWQLEDRVRARQWIWQREGFAPAAHPVGSTYDEVWAGGWEELFPNDAPGRFEGRELPDHGEWWATPWRVAECAGGASGRVRLVARLGAIRADCEKSIRLDGDDATLSVTYAIRSLEPEPFHFLFKQHFPVLLTPACRLVLPGGQAETVDPAFGNLVGDARPFTWPHAATRDGIVDLRSVPPAASRRHEFLYVRQLPEGWCGVDDSHAQASLRMGFDRQVLPFVWLFLSYGGWNGLYTAVLEPCTNLPKDLAAAARLGQCARLEQGAVFRTTVTVTVAGLTTGNPDA